MAKLTIATKKSVFDNWSNKVVFKKCEDFAKSLVPDLESQLEDHHNEVIGLFDKDVIDILVEKHMVQTVQSVTIPYDVNDVSMCGEVYPKEFGQYKRHRMLSQHKFHNLDKKYFKLCTVSNSLKSTQKMLDASKAFKNEIHTVRKAMWGFLSSCTTTEGVLELVPELKEYLPDSSTGVGMVSVDTINLIKDNL